MWSAVIVAIEPSRELPEAFFVGARAAAVGALVLQDLDEARGLAVGLRPLRSGGATAKPGDSGNGEEGVRGGIALGVVGKQFSHLYVPGAVVGEGTLEEGRGGRTALVCERLHVGVAAVVVDGDVAVVQAQ